jgi:hypothetical protein
VLFNEYYTDLERDSLEPTCLILEHDGVVREIPRRLRIAALHWAPDGRRFAASK